jgi:hypothetical protein
MGLRPVFNGPREPPANMARIPRVEVTGLADSETAMGHPSRG